MLYLISFGHYLDVPDIPTFLHFEHRTVYSTNQPKGSSSMVSNKTDIITFLQMHVDGCGAKDSKGN